MCMVIQVFTNSDCQTLEKAVALTIMNQIAGETYMHDITIVFFQDIFRARISKFITTATRVVMIWFQHRWSMPLGPYLLCRMQCPAAAALLTRAAPGRTIKSLVPSGYDQHSHGIDGPFIDDFPIEPSIYGFSMAMLNNQMVLILKILTGPQAVSVKFILIQVCEPHIYPSR